MRIHGSIEENKILLKANPEYLTLLDGLTDPNQRKAWRDGDWAIAAGGYFTDVWDYHKQVVNLTLKDIPASWSYRRSFDWGSARPASLGIWAISDGSPAVNGQYFPKGSVIRLAEWYACERDRNGHAIPNKGLKLSNLQLGREIIERSMGLHYSGCVADPSIFKEQGGPSIYEQMVKANPTLVFYKADNERVTGWQTMRSLMAESMKDSPEKPGLWINSNCVDWIRTVPVLMRDEKKFDDVDTNMEDHIADETRYLCQTGNKITRSRELIL